MTATEQAISVVPANQASWGVLCRVPAEERADRLREQTDCGHPESDTTHSRIPWVDRAEDKTDDSVWCRDLLVLHVGTAGVFADAGFTEVSRPTLRRVVMRIDFDAPDTPKGLPARPEL